MRWVASECMIDSSFSSKPSHGAYHTLALQQVLGAAQSIQAAAPGATDKALLWTFHVSPAIKIDQWLLLLQTCHLLLQKGLPLRRQLLKHIKEALPRKHPLLNGVSASIRTCIATCFPCSKGFLKLDLGAAFHDYSTPQRPLDLETHT